MDDEVGWLSVTEIARRLGRPPSTVRYWRNTFRASLSERTDDDGRPSYRLAAFERIDALLSRRTPRAEIRRDLERHHGAGEGPAPPATLDDVVAELRALRVAVEQIAIEVRKGAVRDPEA